MTLGFGSLAMRYLGLLVVLLAASFVSTVSTVNAANGVWEQIGPYGGDVRSLAAHPGDFSRLFLGTSNAQVYASSDGGRSWQWWSEIAARHDYVVDELLFDATDPRVMYAGVWSLEPGGGGGVYKSTDQGRTWEPFRGMAGQSVRSLVQSRAHPRVLVAGSMTGVFRSTDGGRRWTLISPPNHEEIRNIESLAIDPANPDIIYAGTWHLPWKTTDGGQTWRLIKTGMLDDSDVFSIAIDWSNPGVVYASACSGIYRSESAGELWKKIQGIPHSARRTRVIRQDPVNAAVVYAGTTEGLWQTSDSGASWRRLTAASLIVNDIQIDRQNPSRVFLATDRAGVLVSTDAGRNFQAANQGFAHRQISDLAYDADARRTYAAVLNDKDHGGVFWTNNGREWTQASAGLRDDVFALIYARTSQGGRLLAGLRDGLAAFDAERNEWKAAGRITGAARVVERLDEPAAGGRRPARKAPRAPARPLANLNFTFSDFFQEAPDQPVYAATNRGLLASPDAGQTWQVISPKLNFTAVSGDGKFLVAGTHYGLELSFNGGVYWFRVYLPVGSGSMHVNGVAVSGKTVFAATDTGLFRSPDAGARWEKKGRGVPYGPVTSVRVAPGNPREVYVTSRMNGAVYVSRDGGQNFTEMERAGLVGRRMRGVHILPDGGANGEGRYQLLASAAFGGLFRRVVTPRVAENASGGGAAAAAGAAVTSPAP